MGSQVFNSLLCSIAYTCIFICMKLLYNKKCIHIFKWSPQFWGNTKGGTVNSDWEDFTGKAVFTWTWRESRASGGQTNVEWWKAGRVTWVVCVGAGGVQAEVGEVREVMCHSIPLQGNQVATMPITLLKNPWDYQERLPGMERKEVTDRMGRGGREGTQVKKTRKTTWRRG